MSTEQMSPLSAEVAVEQIARLASLRGFVADNPVVIKDVIRCMRKWCTGGTRHGKTITPDQQCRMVIDVAIERLEGWRGPVQLRDILDDLFPNYPTIE